tara:strand:- start:281 stop:694 length:414 start_codon:yes stop_codon:yes gene_type:complete
MDKQAVIKTFTELQAVEIEFVIFNNAYLKTKDGQDYKDWPYEVNSIEFSDVNYDMIDKWSDEYPEAIREYSSAYVDLVNERFHASEGVLIEAVHGYLKTLPEYQQKWKSVDGNETDWLTVTARMQEDDDLLVILETN